MGQKYVATKCQIYLKTNCVSEFRYRGRVCRSWACREGRDELGGHQGYCCWISTCCLGLPAQALQGDAALRAVTERSLAHRGLDRRQGCLISSQPAFFSSVLAGEMGLRQRTLGLCGGFDLLDEDHCVAIAVEQALTPNCTMKVKNSKVFRD